MWGSSGGSNGKNWLSYRQLLSEQGDLAVSQTSIALNVGATHGSFFDPFDRAHWYELSISGKPKQLFEARQQHIGSAQLACRFLFIEHRQYLRSGEIGNRMMAEFPEHVPLELFFDVLAPILAARPCSIRTQLRLQVNGLPTGENLPEGN